MIKDTHPKMERLHIELLRQVPPWRKVELLGQMVQTMKHLALIGLRQRHPEAGDDELRRRLADILLGASLAERCLGPSPRDELYVD